jgi:hypothetical protein
LILPQRTQRKDRKIGRWKKEGRWEKEGSWEVGKIGRQTTDDR